MNVIQLIIGLLFFVAGAIVCMKVLWGWSDDTKGTSANKPNMFLGICIALCLFLLGGLILFPEFSARADSIFFRIITYKLW